MFDFLALLGLGDVGDEAALLFQALHDQFARYEADAGRLLDLEKGALVLPAYEATLKCSHLFNVLDARGALSVTDRAAHIQRIRKLACRAADAWLEKREAEGFPLLAGAAAGEAR